MPNGFFVEPITIRGYNRVRNQLRYLVGKYQDDVYDIIGDFVDDTVDVLKSEDYPAPPPPSESELDRKGGPRIYERTGQLAAGWSYVPSGSTGWAIVNLTDYSGWVVGEGTQAKVHQWRWWTGEEVVQREVEHVLTPRLTQFLEEKLEEQDDNE